MLAVGLRRAAFAWSGYTLCGQSRIFLLFVGFLGCPLVVLAIRRLRRSMSRRNAGIVHPVAHID